MANNKIYILLALILPILGEKPIPGRVFSRPLFLRQEAAAPYPPSGWKPAGDRLVLPSRQEAEVPHTVYGPPSSSTAAPAVEYGPPAESPQQPAVEYGPPQEPENSYGAPIPPQGNEDLPVEAGASERLRQQQFFQQLPGFQASRFLKPSRLRQAPKPQRLQNPRPRPQQQKQQLKAQNQQNAQQQELYQAPNNNNNVAVATAVSGEYYVVEPHGRLQRVAYTTMNGRLVDGHITSGIHVDDIHDIHAPIYEVNELNELIRIN